MKAFLPSFATPETLPSDEKLVGTYYETPHDMFPPHMFYPEFKTLDLWFPALDAWVLTMLCEKLQEKKDTYGASLRIMEIGSYAGGSAGVLSRYANYMLCVDTWAGSGVENDEMKPLYADHCDVYETFLKNIELFPCKPEHHVRTLNPDSLPEYLRQQPWRRYDLIFVDGGHDYESVKADIEIAEHWIVPGGIICGHDFASFKGLTQAVLEFELDGACGTVWWKEMP